MDPAIQALTIRPADWAALLDGFVEGLSYELGLLVCISVVGVAMFLILGRRGVSTEGLAQAQTSVDDKPAAAGQPTSTPGARPQPAPSVVLVASGPYAVRLAHRPYRCARRRVHRRAAASLSFG